MAAFQIGDGEFISLPGEVFPFTYFRSFLGAHDMPFPQYGLPQWPLPHMHTPFRFFNGLAEDMIGYIFPRGNGVGVPGRTRTTRARTAPTDSAVVIPTTPRRPSSQAADILAGPLVDILDSHGGTPERIVTGRYVLPDGSLSRDPLGRPVLKCKVDTTYEPFGPGNGGIHAGLGLCAPTTWMSLDGRPASHARPRHARLLRRGQGNRVWLDVFRT